MYHAVGIMTTSWNKTEKCNQNNQEYKSACKCFSVQTDYFHTYLFYMDISFLIVPIHKYIVNKIDGLLWLKELHVYHVYMSWNSHIVQPHPNTARG